MPEISPLTRALRAGIDVDTQHGAVVAPIYLSSTFTFERLGEPREYDYTRTSNPTRDDAAEAVALLEGGAGATIVATGMAATTTALFALVEPGATIVVSKDCYGGTWRLFDRFGRNGQFRVVWAELSDTDAATELIRSEQPALVWIETPSNPLLRITDHRAIADAAHEAGAVVVTDNTFLTPLGQRPFELGADVVVHSATKYLNGHSDVVAGVVVAKTPETHAQVRFWANTLGTGGAPFDAYLVTRGIRTLDVRWRRHQENARVVAELLRDHPAVARVNYPGFEDHPGHALAAQQQLGFGAMLSFDLVGGRDAAARFAQGLELFGLAVSLGGTESLACHPATMTHASLTQEARDLAGIGDGLIRLSIGIEPVEDLVADLRAGLERAGATASE